MNKFQEGSFQQFWRREHLITNNIPLDKIAGLHRVENTSLADIALKFVDEFEARRINENPFGACSMQVFINCPVSIAFQYCSNIFSLEEWSFGTREIQEYRGGLFAGTDRSVPDTQIFLRREAYTDCKTIDHLSAWDQGDELWMRSYFRLVDAKQALNKPGTLLMHSSNYHPFFCKGGDGIPEYIRVTQMRESREWIGQSWALYCARQRIELHNLKTILESRYS